MGCRCRLALLDSSTQHGQSRRARRAARWGEAERAAEVVAAAVLPCAKNVLRRPSAPRPASRASAARRDLSTRRVRRAGAGPVLRSALRQAHAMNVPAPCSLTPLEIVTPSSGGSAALRVEYTGRHRRSLRYSPPGAMHACWWGRDCNLQELISAEARTRNYTTGASPNARSIHSKRGAP